MSWIRKLLSSLDPSDSVDFFHGVDPPGITTLEQVARLILEGNEDNGVVVMVGAGISTSAGIPDFRSPDGVYHSLAPIDLPFPEALFDIEYFRKHPQPFYNVSHELKFGTHEPTLAHCFLRLLHEKKRLVRIYTQNVDGLEARAGIPSDKIIASHGAFDRAECSRPGCTQPADFKKLKAALCAKTVIYCDACGAPIKPGVIFFGENLPQHFFDRRDDDFARCRTLLILGTSLKVQPFAGLIHYAPPLSPRVVFNLERVGQDSFGLFGSSPGLHYGHGRDVFVQGTCDDSCLELARLLGWEAELRQLRADILRALAEEDAESLPCTPQPVTPITPSL